MSTARTFRHALTVNKVASRFVAAKKVGADAEKIDKAELFAVLDKAENSLGKGYWRGEYNGYSLWIGDPGGSRVGQFEGQITKGGRAVEFRARTFAALKNAFLKQLKDFAG